MCLKRAGGAAAAAASASSICSCATCHSCHSCWHRITRTTDKRTGYQLQLQQLQLPLQLPTALLPAALFRFALFRFSINFALTAASPNAFATATGSDAATATAAEAAYLFPPPNAVTRKLCNVIFNMTSAANPPQSHLPSSQGAAAVGAAAAAAVKIINAINGNRNICAAPASCLPPACLAPPPLRQPPARKRVAKITSHVAAKLARLWPTNVTNGIF